MTKLTKSERKLIAKVYLDAAELIAVGKQHCCCYAIEITNRQASFTKECRLFSSLYQEGARNLSGHSIGFWAEERRENHHIPEVRSRRVLLLVMASYLVEQGIFP